MAKDPAFLCYYKEILVSCADWDADLLGWYLRLLCHQADKPEGLINDIESIAALANVKFKDFSRFSECWKRTLQHMFVVNDKGRLVNLRQETVLSERKEYTKTQAIRGVIGAFIKNNRIDFKLTSDQWKAFSKSIMKDFSMDKYKTDPNYLQARLLAYVKSISSNKEDANADGNKAINGNKETISSTLIPIDEPVYTDVQKENFEKFQNWINQNAPSVAKLKKPFTIEQFIEITKLDLSIVMQKLLAMENKPDLTKSYSSAYLTLLAWYQKDKKDESKTKWF